MINQSTDLTDIEKRIALLIQSNMKSWKSAYVLLKQVENDMLWQTAGYHSYTDWLNHMANTYNVSKMALWKARSAGDIYLNYYKRVTERGETAKAFEDAEIPQDSLIYLERMAQGDVEKRDEMIAYSIKHRVSKSTVKGAWDKTRHLIQQKGGQPLRANGYMSYNYQMKGIDQLKILENEAYPVSTDSNLSDREILTVVHKYLGASVDRYSLERALKEYVRSFD